MSERSELLDLPGMQGGLSTLALGPPGSGKSHLLSTAAELGRAKLIAFRPKEINSRGYVTHGIAEDAELFHDPGWRPSIDKYEAGAWLDLMTRLDELMTDDEYDVVLFDPLTDIQEIISHEILAKENASSVDEYSDRYGYWGQMRQKWIEFTKAITALNFASRPKHVLSAVHAKIPHEEEKEEEGIRFWGDVIPSMGGSYKLDIGGEFHIQVFTRMEHEYDQKTREQEEFYRMQVRPSPQAQTKVSLLTKEELPADRLLPNSYPQLLTEMREALENAGG